MIAEAREIADWCLATGQPFASWQVMTEIERRVFMEVAVEMHERMAEARRA